MHRAEPLLGMLDAKGVASAIDLRDGRHGPLDAVSTELELTQWAMAGQRVEAASPWTTDPHWVSRARTCVRWVERGETAGRFVAWTDATGATVARRIPHRADARSVRLDPRHPLHPGDGEWLVSPTPEGIALFSLGAPGRARSVALAAVDRELAQDLGGHPDFASALHRLGLRWDGEEMYLDCLRGATHDLLADASEVLVAEDDTRLARHPDQGDRVYWSRPSDPVHWVLPHPTLARIPHPIRHLPASDRPRVRMLGWALDERGGYLGMWRAAGDSAALELWSVRAHDRLKAWALHVPAGEARLVLRRPTPDHLPLLWALERHADDVLVHLVEFGDRRVAQARRLRNAGRALDAIEPVDDGVWAASGARYMEEP